MSDSNFIAFPTAKLPKVLADFITESADAMGCDESYLALPLLAAVASAVGNTRRIKLKNSWSEPAVLWCAVVGDSGTLKSPAIDAAIKPVRRRQESLLKDHAKASAEHKAEREKWKALPKDERGAEPEAPPPVEHPYCSEITVEALADRLAKTPRGVLVAVDELAGWFGSFNAYKSGGSDVAHWLSMHRAGALKVDRKTGDKPTLWIPNAAVSIVGGIQTKTLRRVLTPEFFDNGLAARLLLAMPPSKQKQWSEADISAPTEDAVRRLFNTLYEFRATTGTDGELIPALVELDEDAKAEFIAFFNEHANEQAELGEGELAAAWSKLEGYAARLALVVHCVRHASGDSVDPRKVDADSMRVGIELCRWFGGETKRIYAALACTDEDRERATLVAWIRDRGSIITVRQLSRGPARFQKPGAAEAALAELVDAGIGEWFHPPTQAKGGRPPMEFRLLLDASDASDDDKTPRRDSANGGYGTDIDKGRGKP